MSRHISKTIDYMYQHDPGMHSSALTRYNPPAVVSFILVLMFTPLPTYADLMDDAQILSRR